MAAAEQRGIVLFVHGFGSSSKCWSRLLELLGADDRITSRYELRTWDYPTHWFGLNPLTRIPRLQEIGRSLADEIDSPSYRGRPLTLVGHSQGGLVILSYLSDTLANGEGSKLRALRQALLVATPCEGSTTASGLRGLASKVFSNPQERTLRVLDPEIADIRSAVDKRIVATTADSDTSWRVPIHAFSGLQDNVVPEASARGPFESVRRVPGDHFSILTPADASDRRYTELVEPLLDPGGHLHRFEIESYEVKIRVEPRPRQSIITSGTNSRVVDYDNYGTLRRTVRFAACNRCRDTFSIKYATRSQGYIIGHESHVNQASPADIGRAEDTGTYYQFDFVPEDGQDYSLNVEVYRGFDEGDRDVHFHLGAQSFYRQLDYVLDLSAYVRAGYGVSKGPEFFIQPQNIPHGDMCRTRDGLTPIPPTGQTAEGIYYWSLRDISTGVVDIVWDVAVAGAPSIAVGAVQLTDGHAAT